VPEADSLPQEFLVRGRGEGTGWQDFTPEQSKAKVDLPGLVRDVPEFLSMGTDGAPAFRATMPVRTPGEEACPIFLAVDEQGSLAVVGCPDVSQPNACRALVADVFATSGRLWHLSYARFVAGFEKHLREPLEDYVAGRAGPDWTVESFRAGITECLESGRFRVLVATDGITPELDEALGYFVSMNIEVRPLGYSVLSSGGLEILVVAMPGMAEAPEAPRRSRTAVSSSASGQGTLRASQSKSGRNDRRGGSK
jgi:hypothetical protein